MTQATGNFGTNQALVTHNYRYDAIGNILEKAGVLYSYTDPLHPSAVTSTSDGKSYTYDANGNMVTGGTRTYTWDFDNRLDTVNASGGSLIMAYDYTGARVKKTGSSGTTLYPFSGYEVSPTGVITKYLRIGIENVVSKKSTGDVLFYHNDHLGGVNITTNSLGIMAQTTEYDPWGKVSRDEGIGDSVRRFTGKQLDPESGLYYYGGRYYDPELGRFISPDPFVPQPSDPQSLNRYSYVRNDPVNHIDPSGFFFKKLFKAIKKFFSNPIKAIVSIVVGVVAAAVVGPIAGALAEAVGASASTAATVATVAGGAAFGAASAGVSGGDPLLGAVSGGIAAGIGPPVFSALGGGATASALTNFAAAVGTGAVTGAAVGAVSTAISGGKFGENVGFGAFSGAVTTAAIYGGYRGLQFLGEAVSGVSGSSDPLAGLQLAAAEQTGGTVSDVCKICGSEAVANVEGQLRSFFEGFAKIHHVLDKALTVVGFTGAALVAAGTGAVLIGAGNYLIATAVVAGPAAPLVSAAGALTIAGGIIAEIGAVKIASEIPALVQPSRVPGSVPSQ